MTEKQLSDSIGAGLIPNTVHLFWTKALIASGNRKRMCPKIYKLAWQLYVESVKDIPAPDGLEEQC